MASQASWRNALLDLRLRCDEAALLATKIQQKSIGEAWMLNVLTVLEMKMKVEDIIRQLHGLRTNLEKHLERSGG
jgi:hypothetical protein